MRRESGRGAPDAALHVLELRGELLSPCLGAHVLLVHLLQRCLLLRQLRFDFLRVRTRDSRCGRMVREEDAVQGSPHAGLALRGLDHSTER